MAQGTTSQALEEPATSAAPTRAGGASTAYPAGYDPRLEQDHRGIKGALVLGVTSKIMTRRTASAASRMNSVIFSAPALALTNTFRLHAGVAGFSETPVSRAVSSKPHERHSRLYEG
jgi:hypothetical protein